MATFTGTNANETIAPGFVSPTVAVNGAITPGAGADTINAGSGNDTLNGDGGTDILNGEDGDDRMIWTGGGGSDVFEGGADVDTAEVNGGSGGEVFTITANGARVRFDRLDPDPFSLDIGTTERLVVNMGAGNDVLSSTGNLAALITITVDGGAGNDVIFGSNGIDRLLGGIGDDFIDGQQGNDVAFLGDGNDVFQWDPGDGSDAIEGQAGTDRLLFNGSAGNEIFEASANGMRTLFTRNLGNIVMDTNDVERIDLNALGGTDEINVNALPGTDVATININLAGTIGGSVGDAAIDDITVNGSAAANNLSLSTFANRSKVNVLVSEPTDSITVAGVAGNDTIEVGAFLRTITINGGTQIDTVSYRQATASVGVNLINPLNNTGAAAGHAYISIENITGSIRNDILTGNNVANILDGNTGNDTLFGGLGNDTLTGGLGADILRGEGGNDTYVLENGTDNVIDASGTDTATSTIARTLAGAYAEIENLTLLGTANIKGTGNGLKNILTGNAKNNTLDGGANNDTLIGKAGNDILIGGVGKDMMTGGTGSDIFRFLNKSHSANTSLRDTITDFDDGGTGDKIDVSGLFGPVMTYRHSAAFTAAGQARINDIAGAHVIVEVNTGGTLAADFSILLTNTTLASMAANDFVL